MGLLEGKVALISGTASGQGRAAALIFAREGARIFGCDMNVDGSNETVRLVREAGGEMESLHPCDLTDPAAADAWVATADKAGGVDILYNNAGSLRSRGPFGESNLADWNATLLYELTLVYIASRAAWSRLVTRGGAVILNVASIQAHREIFPSRSPAHGAAKAGVLALTRTLAAEGAPHGIRAISISPGLVRSPTTMHFWGNDATNNAKRKAFFDKIPLGRAGECEEIAEVSAFLCSPRGSYINAADLIVDGGMIGTSYGSYDALPPNDALP